LRLGKGSRTNHQGTERGESRTISKRWLRHHFS
jgi:hypothetical protein